MLLTRLKEYADTRMPNPPPPLYSMTPIAYVIELDPDGAPRSRTPTPQADTSDRKQKRGKRMLAPEVVRSAGVKPLLLADNSEYTFGLARDAEKQARTDACHTAYRELLADCDAATNDPAVRAVSAFYERGGATQLDFDTDFDLAGKVTFRVHLPGGPVQPIDVVSVQQFWAARNDPGSTGGTPMDCLICGQTKPVLDRLQGKVKGVLGGQSAGTSIISANAEAFESYGLEASRVAPVCADCAERFTRAANALIAGEPTHLYIGGETFIFWARTSDFSPFTLLTNPEPQDVAAMIDAARTGKRMPAFADDDLDQFYAASFSGSGGRTVVRDWLETTVREAQESLARWFELQSIVDWNGSTGKYLGIRDLAAGTVPVRRGRTDWDSLSKVTPRRLLRSALTGTPASFGLLAEAVARTRAEQQVSRRHAALIKLVLLSQDPGTPKEGYMVALEHDHPEVAYHCGRMLAALEKVQRRAMPGVNATIIDRFYGTASSAPASVFGRLTRGAQPHLSKLERDSRGAYISLQREMEDIAAQIPSFPRTLTLEDQGLFALGYYHQRAYRAPAKASNTPEETTNA